MDFVNLTPETVLDYAITAYEENNYIKSEFAEGYKIFRYVKRLFLRYRMTGELKHNLILNHMNMIYNMFGIEAGTRLLFYKLDKEDWSALKTFMILLNTVPGVIPDIRGSDIDTNDIPVDMVIAGELRRI